MFFQSCYFLVSSVSSITSSTRTQSKFTGYISTYYFIIGKLYIIAKTLRYLRSHRGAWRSFHNTDQTFLVPCIRCTDHLCDSCGLIGVNPHFAAPGCRFDFKIKCWPIVTSSIQESNAIYSDITVTDCSSVVSMDSFLSQWRWGHSVDTSAMTSYSSLIIERICGAVTNGFGNLAAMG